MRLKTLAVAVILLLLHVPTTSAASYCGNARDNLTAQLDGATPNLASDLILKTIRACGLELVDPTTGTSTSDSLIEGCLPASAFVTSASFRANVEIAGTFRQSLPDVGTAIIGVIGGDQNPAVYFDGDGLVFGALTDSTGTFKFPKVAKMPLPGIIGTADATCQNGVPCHTTASATFLTGGIYVEITGATVNTCNDLPKVDVPPVDELIERLIEDLSDRL